MSLFLNIPSRVVITFLPRSKHLLISWLQSPSAVILEPQKMKSLTVSIGPNLPLSVSAIRVVSSAYLRLLIFLLAVLSQLVLHPAQHFS